MIQAIFLGLALAAAGERARSQDFLVAEPRVEWLKTYSVSPIREIWSMSLEVKDLQAAVPKVIKTFEDAGGSLTSPLAHFAFSPTAGTQQLRWRITVKGAQAAAKKLKKLGASAEPIIRPEIDPVPLPEVKEKIRLLEAEKAAHAGELAAMPTASGMMGELLAHLKRVEAVREKNDPEVLVNITVRAAAPKKNLP